MFGEIPATSTSRLFDQNDNEFRAIHENDPMSIQTTNAADLNFDATSYTKTEVDNSLALKHIVINNVPGTGEEPLQSNCFKRVFAVSRLKAKTYLNMLLLVKVKQQRYALTN